MPMISMNDREHGPGDPRAENAWTEVSPHSLYEVYERYIQCERRPLRGGKPMKLPYRYLFI